MELGLDYTKECRRYLVRPPNAPFEAKDVLSKWAKVLRSMKMAQMQSENHNDWPDPKWRPWDILSSGDMFVGMWVEHDSKWMRLTC